MEKENLATTPIAQDKPVKTKKNRIWEIDFLRGFSVLLMVCDHLLYDFTMLRGMFGNYSSHSSNIAPALYNFGVWWYYNSDIRSVLHVIFVSVFCLLVGVSCSFSRSNPKRAGQLFLVSLIFSAVTFGAYYLFDISSIYIVFGILNLFCVSILVYSLLKMLPGHKLIMTLVGVGIIALRFLPEFDATSIERIVFLVPSNQTIENFLKIAVGLARSGADWQPLVPWMGVVLIGGVLGEELYQERKSLLPKLDGKWNKPFCFVGRSSLLIYITHQPILVGILFVIMSIIGYY